MKKFALIGCGRIAHRHAEQIQKYGQLVDVCDIIKERALAFKEEYGCNSFSNYRELLDKSHADVICICTPNGLHAEQTIASLKAGFHVLCEKPMALSSKDCGEMINQSLTSDRRLFIVKQNRFNPPVSAVKEAIENSKLGRILSVQLNCFWNRDANYYENSWKGTEDLDGGTLYTQFSHFVDLLYWLIGDIEAAEGFKKNYIHDATIEFEDSGVAILRFESGTIGTINYTINAYGKNMEGSLTVFGENGTVKIGGQYLNELEYQNIASYQIEGLPEGNPANNYGQYQGSMSNHGDVYANVVEVLDGKANIATNGYEGLKTVEIIEKIYQNSDG